MSDQTYTPETLAALADKYPDGPSHATLELFASAWKALEDQLVAMRGGGWELVGSPKRCLEFIKDRMATVMKVAATNKTLRAELDAAKAREEALSLPKHRCEMVAAAQWNDVGGRAHWVGRLLEPIPGYEEETHCMHFVTPLKGEVVFGFIEADFHQLAALCEAASEHPTNRHWLALKVQDYIGNVRYLRQEGVREAGYDPEAVAARSRETAMKATYGEGYRAGVMAERARIAAGINALRGASEPTEPE